MPSRSAWSGSRRRAVRWSATTSRRPSSADGRCPSSCSRRSLPPVSISRSSPPLVAEEPPQRVRERLDPLGDKAVEDEVTLAARLDEARIRELPQVLRQARFRDPDEGRELLGRPRPLGDQLERAKPCRLAERAQE